MCICSTKASCWRHNRPILVKGASVTARQAEEQWWQSAATWGDSTGYRRGTTARALDNKPFLVAVATAFSTSALAPATGGGLSNTLNADQAEGLVQATLEQVAWASFKVNAMLPNFKLTVQCSGWGAIHFPSPCWWCSWLPS